MRASARTASIVTLAFAFVVPAPGDPAKPSPAPTPGASELPGQLRATVATSTNGMVVCSSEVASRAGARILEAGGNAVDAAVAAAFALGVGEIGASGLGGQTYMLICPAGGACIAIDGSVVAPLRCSRPELQRLKDQGRFYGARVVAAPATLAALTLALSRYGTKPLAEVMAPAIEAAEAGVVFSPAMQTYVDGYLDKLRDSPYLASILLENNLYVWGLSHTYCFSDLACTLRRIAAEGPSVFYTGEIGDAIASDLERGGGYVRRDDLARVRATERQPFTGSYRGLEIVSFPLPGAGGSLIEALHILDSFPPEKMRRESPARYELQIEATRLAMADDHSARQPTYEAGAFLLDRTRAQQRARLIRPDRALTAKELGDPELTPWAERDTTQLSVVDRFGNAVSVTQTLSRIFGGYTATPGLGFPYNGLLEAFDLEHPESRSFLLPLRPPFTTQSPTIVRRDGRPFLVLGSVGSGRITSAVLLAISNVVDQGMDLQTAVEAPRVLWGGNQENKVYLELAGPITDALADELAKRGYTNMYRLHFPPRQIDLNAFGCVNAVLVQPDGTLVGVGDPRRQGVAVAAGPPGSAPASAAPPACWRTLWALPGTRVGAGASDAGRRVP